jgi:gas vesicle protein
MFGPRMLFGAALGGALVYFLDPHQGAQRRERVLGWWEQNREPVMNTAASAASTAQARVNETSARVGEKVTQAGEKVNEKVTQAGEKVSEKVTELQSKVRREANRHDLPRPASLK